MSVTPDGFIEPKEKPKTRPVREILEEIVKEGKRRNKDTLVLEQILLPWINTDALANAQQEKAIRAIYWFGAWKQEDLHLKIILLNTLRG